jgi:predicted nuclease of restriction endonuclease-like RecB superfamily
MLLSDLPDHRKQAGEMMLMTTARDEKVPTSSIVMKAIDAKTFTELQAFVKDLESRPTERLLRDLPDLVKLSDAKAEIITYVIATKFRRAASEERQKIRESVQATSDGLPHGQERSRVQDILERIRGLAV